MSGDRFLVDLERPLRNALPAELRLDAPATGVAEGGGALGLGEQGAHGGGEGGGIGGRHEPAGLVVDDHLADAPTPVATTGVPQAIASRLISPKGSYTDGQTKSAAWL